MLGEKASLGDQFAANIAQARQDGEQASRVNLFIKVHDELNSTAKDKGANNYGHSKYTQEVILSKIGIPQDIVDLINQNKPVEELKEIIHFLERTDFLMNSHVDINCGNRNLGKTYFSSMQNKSASFITEGNFQFVCMRDSRCDTNPSSPERAPTVGAEGKRRCTTALLPEGPSSSKRPALSPEGPSSSKRRRTGGPGEHTTAPSPAPSNQRPNSA